VVTERFRIGGVSLSLSVDDAARHLPIRASYRGFAEPSVVEAAGNPVDAELGAAERIEIRASVGPLSTWIDELDRNVVYDPSGFWSAHRVRDRVAFACREPGGESAGIWRLLLADVGGTRWQITTCPEPRFLDRHAAADTRLADPLAFPAAELILLDYLSRRAGALLHACGVVDRAGRGYLFCGRSGAGKSTVAGLWDGLAIVLNDDRTLLRRGAGSGFRIHGTPWHGDFSRTDPGSAPLCGVFFLKQATTHGFERVSAASARRQLLTSWWLPLWDKSAGLLQELALCSEVGAAVPAFELSFRPDRGVCDTVRRAIDSVSGEAPRPEEPTWR
jgi:hypothetical protein